MVARFAACLVSGDGSQLFRRCVGGLLLIVSRCPAVGGLVCPLPYVRQTSPAVMVIYSGSLSSCQGCIIALDDVGTMSGLRMSLYGLYIVACGSPVRLATFPVVCAGSGGLYSVQAFPVQCPQCHDNVVQCSDLNIYGF